MNFAENILFRISPPPPPLISSSLLGHEITVCFILSKDYVAKETSLSDLSGLLIVAGCTGENHHLLHDLSWLLCW